MTLLVRFLGRLLCVAGLLWISLSWLGCETMNDSAPAGAADGPPPTAETFKVGDTVTITFSGTPTPPPAVTEARIKEDGTVNLPMIGRIKFEGKLEGQLEEEIQKKYVPDYFKVLNVSVKGEDRFFFVGGEVKTPSRLIYAGAGMTVLKAITAAGGFTDFAQKKAVELTRANGKTYKINCIKAQQKPELDLPIFPNDRIYVKRRLY